MSDRLPPVPPVAAPHQVWEVWQDRTLICSRKMNLTEREARNKVENERRLGYFMEARPVPEFECPRCHSPAEQKDAYCDRCAAIVTENVAPAAVAAPLSEPPHKFAQTNTRNYPHFEHRPSYEELESDLAAARLTVQQLTQELKESRELNTMMRAGHLQCDGCARLQVALDAERALRQQLERDIQEVLDDRADIARRTAFQDERLFCEAVVDDLRAALAAGRGSASPDPKDA